MPQWVVAKIADALNDRQQVAEGQPHPGAGHRLQARRRRHARIARRAGDGAVCAIAASSVEYTDPHVPVFPKMREHNFDLKSVELTPERSAPMTASSC